MRTKKIQLHGWIWEIDNLAESQGFEPRKGLHPCWFSRPVHSTTLPTLRLNSTITSDQDSKFNYFSPKDQVNILLFYSLCEFKILHK